MIAIIDYGMGNVRSVYNGVTYFGADAEITADPKVIDDATHLILPGVGAFGKAIHSLRRNGLAAILKRQVFEHGKPFLGICLGMQVLAGKSYEHGAHEGLGWLDAEVRRFTCADQGLKVPHVGWNSVDFRRRHPLFGNLKPTQNVFYFVHSYHMVCKNQEDILATCEYGYPFPAAVSRDNIWATQFHPEKSQDNGLQALKNFVNWNP